MANLISFSDACTQLNAGNVVAFPTETVYGLGANATDDKAVAKIYTLKERPIFNPLIVHVKHLEEAKKYASFSPLATELAGKFWPGPLTLILPLKHNSPLSRLVTAGLPTVGIRVPAHPVAQRLLATLNAPVAAPSANPSGRLSPTSAEHVIKLFQDKDLQILAGEEANIGVESTIIDVSTAKPVILRYGGLSKDDISKIIPNIAFANASKDIKAPGQLLQHYAPKIPLRLNATTVHKGEALLAFGAPLNTSGPMMNLSLSGDINEAASHLFAFLHQLEDIEGVSAIAVMPIPEDGLGFAINDRLKRGAA